MNNQHLVPQVIIDVAENLSSTTNENSRNAYIMRLETIRDYCDNVLRKQPLVKIYEPKNRLKERK
jgi:hypothetical protein